MKNLIFLSSLIFLITACSKKDENISIEKKYSQNSLESKYEKEILNKNKNALSVWTLRVRTCLRS